MHANLGINCCFAVNRYIEPEAWGQIVGEQLGLRSVQFVSDLLNPFWPKDYIDAQTERINRSADQYQFSVDSIFTGTYSRVNHLTHPDERAREIWKEWFKDFFRIGRRLGAKTGGSHFGILTFNAYNDDDKRNRIIEYGIKAWQELSFFAQDLGYEALIFEPMSVPREFANTVQETREIMDAVNSNCGIPLKVCLDVGHAPHPDERDPYRWLEELGKDSPIIHIQQTVFGKSMHWPFTKEHEKEGIIKAEKVLNTLEASGCKETTLMFEVLHREHWETDGVVIQDHKESVDYWRQYVAD